ncbi:zinc finger protein 429-like [Asterias rubens]|uniref:zinc finger protein 429-like n=1 Tax=Asterias rubens TaxID=7604 RepID=UPI00145526BB|nr:zinc finger protein 429-like [Asterias rubens]XP_033626870.1 zinc finger protein 429-like [Asterias rubens]
MEEPLDKLDEATSQDTFICGRCQHKCDSVIAFLKHQTNHKDVPRGYRCELCFEEFSSDLSMVEHYSDHHRVSFQEGDPVNEKNPYEVVEVGETDGKIIAVVVDPDTECINDEDENVYSLIRKQIPEKATGKYLRDTINYRFALETVTVQGAKFTYGKSIYRCLFCDHHTYEVEMMSRHMFDSHKNFINDYKVGKYEKMFLEKKKKDGEEFRGQITSLSNYRSCLNPLRHKNTRLKVKQRQKKKTLESYPCQTCGKVFKKARLRRVHMETHRTEKNFLCDECGKAFKSRNRLTAHRRSHREKIFKCQQCGFQSKLHSEIHMHRQVHSSGCVLCHICGSAYTDRSTLTKHMAVHSMDRPFPCLFPGCTWRFKTEPLCRAHYRAHTTKGRFKCQICNYLFRHKHHLSRHLGAVHGIEIMKHHPMRAEIVPTGDNPPVSMEGGATDMQMIQVVLNNQEQQEVVPGGYDIIVNMSL